MRKESTGDLAQCAEFSQTLRARPPRVVHGTALLLCALIAAAFVWAALTQVDRVVKSPPTRVRPIT
jgi:hypothetical protein